MVFQSQLSLEWLMNIALGLFWIVLLLDWLSFIIIASLGYGLGFIAYFSFNSLDFSQLSLESAPRGYVLVYMYVYAIILGIIFSRNKALMEESRQKALKSMGASIAHEMRTPLAAFTTMGASLEWKIQKIEQYLRPQKIQKEASQELEDTKEIAHDLMETAKHSQVLISLLLTNLRQDFNALPLETLSIKDCIAEALKTYPFQPDEHEKVHLNMEKDFQFEGNKDIMIHVFFNLLKNSLYFIHAAGKGDVFITLESTNRVIFKDTGPGIESHRLKHLFTPFYSYRPHGTGIGLTFCKRAMESMGGKIRVNSKFGSHTTFTLEFLEN